MRLLKACLSLFCLSLFPAAWACDFNDDDGPDVALVLSGGGALTTTQAGALTLIEELGVPIHCVLGTSMGSVTGALYASGYSAQDIADIYSDGTRDWGAIFRGGIGREDKPFLQKENEDQYFSGYFAGIGEDGIKLPGGFVDMSGLQAEFRRLFGHLPSEINFTTDLEVPFRSVAMNLSTGDAVAFEDGDLVQTLLASMAVPGAYAPREIDGALYVDGGMASQLPVKAAKALGADIIIALDTTIEPPPMTGNPSLGAATQQLVRITVYRNWERDVAELGDGDLLIQPDITGLNTTDFTTAETGLASGRAEAEKFRADLIAIAARAAPAPTKRLNPTNRFVPGGDLVLVNNSSIDDSVISDRLNYKAGDIDNDKKLDQRLRNLAAFGGFGNVDLARSLDGPLLSVEPRALGTTLLQGGVRASTTFDGDGQYALLGRISRRPVSRFGGEASLSIELGTDFGITAQYYQPFGPEGRFFVIPVASYRGEELLFDLGDTRLGEFFEQRGDFRLRLGRELGDWGILSLEGVTTVGNIESRVSVLPEDVIENNFQQGGGGIFFGADTLNRSIWPTEGVRILASGELLYDFQTGAETQKYNLFGSAAFETGPVGLNFRVQAEGVDEDNNNPVQILDLGGFRRLSAFTESSLPNDRYVLTTAEIFHRLTGADQIVNFPVYVGGTLEYANIEFDFLQDGQEEDIFSASLYLGAETFFGPTYLGAGVSDEGDVSIFLHLGRAF